MDRGRKEIHMRTRWGSGIGAQQERITWSGRQGKWGNHGGEEKDGIHMEVQGREKSRS